VSQGVITAWRLSKARYAGHLNLGMTPEITVLEVLCGYDVPTGPGLIAEADPSALLDG